MKTLKIAYFRRLGIQLLLSIVMIIVVIHMTLDYEELFPNNPQAIFGIIYFLIWPFWSFWLIFNKCINIYTEVDYLILINVITGKSEKIQISDIKGYYKVLLSEYLVFVDEDNNNLFSIHEPFYITPYSFIDDLEIPRLDSRII